MKQYLDIIDQKHRCSGVLLHPTSLPSGKLDEDAFKWIDFIKECGLSVWQMLPLGVPQQELSPYQCYSAFALNPAFIDEENYVNPEFSSKHFLEWFAAQKYWLEDYALFMALKMQHEQAPWYEWSEPYRFRDTDALGQFAVNNKPALELQYWEQYCLYQQWQKIHDYASDQEIFLFGDIPIFVAHDSADVWSKPDAFLLNDQGQPSVVAGVPPDYFSETGQRWGNPHYDWEYMQKNKFQWWMDRMKNSLQLFDLVRIDHFRGLESNWVIDAACETAVDGHWQKVPGKELLETLQTQLFNKTAGKLPVVAEDLGIITREVEALRDEFELPGMSVLQFSFDEYSDNPHKPQNIEYDRVVYTGTHDNDTTEGWFASQDEETRQYILKTLDIDNAVHLTDTLIDSALRTHAQLAIIPFQDFLHLGSEARMNLPGTIDNNWKWQFRWDDIPDNLALKLMLWMHDTHRSHTNSTHSKKTNCSHTECCNSKCNKNKRNSDSVSSAIKLQEVA